MKQPHELHSSGASKLAERVLGEGWRDGESGECQPLKSLLQRDISSNSALTGPASIGVDAVAIPFTV
jgi:hypothetical protein